MAKFTVDGADLVVQFSVAEMIVTLCRTTRIPIVLVNSIGVDPQPWQTLNQIVDVTAPIARLFQIADAATNLPLPSPPGWATEGDRSKMFIGRQWGGGGICRRIGRPGAEVFLHIDTWRPAIVIDLDPGLRYIRFIVTHRDPERAASDLQNAILRQFRRTLDGEIILLGPDDPATLTTRGYAETWLGETGQLEAAVERLRQLLPDQVRVLGQNNWATLRTRGNLAKWLGKSGQPEAAVEQFRALLDDSIPVLGSEHPDVLSYRRYLAVGLANTGQYGEAANQLRPLIASQARLLGRGHPDTVRTSLFLHMMESEADTFNER